MYINTSCLLLQTFCVIVTSQAELDMRNVTLNGMACLPGYVLNDVCECNKNDEFIIDCFDDFTAIVLRVSVTNVSVCIKIVGAVLQQT